MKQARGRRLGGLVSTVAAAAVMLVLFLLAGGPRAARSSEKGNGTSRGASIQRMTAPDCVEDDFSGWIELDRAVRNSITLELVYESTDDHEPAFGGAMKGLVATGQRCTATFEGSSRASYHFPSLRHENDAKCYRIRVADDPSKELDEQSRHGKSDCVELCRHRTTTHTTTTGTKTTGSTTTASTSTQTSTTQTSTTGTSTVQSTATSTSTIQSTATSTSTIQSTATSTSTIQSTATSTSTIESSTTSTSTIQSSTTGTSTTSASITTTAASATFAVALSTVIPTASSFS